MYQTLTPYQQLSVSVGIVSTLVVQNNPNRTGLVLVNLSANNISFSLGSEAFVGFGITLTPNGVWEMDACTFFNGQIFAIATGAASTLAVQEFV